MIYYFGIIVCMISFRFQYDILHFQIKVFISQDGDRTAGGGGGKQSGNDSGYFIPTDGLLCWLPD